MTNTGASKASAGSSRSNVAISTSLLALTHATSSLWLDSVRSMASPNLLLRTSRTLVATGYSSASRWRITTFSRL